MLVGGIKCDGKITIRSCEIYRNRSTGTYVAGGAIEIGELGSKSSNCFITDCDIYDNLTNDRGGAISIDQLASGLFRLYDNRIFNNSTPYSELSYDVQNASSTWVDARFNYWGAQDGPSGKGPGSGDSVSDRVYYQPFIKFGNVPNLGDIGCGGMGWASDDNLSTANPISLRLGDKRIEETDISVQTPIGSLDFTRSYNQSRQSVDKLLGLGWTHNHASELTFPETNTPKQAAVRLPNGGVLFLNEVQPDYYEAVGGSVSKMSYDSGADEYTLTTQDDSEFIFELGDDRYRLKTIIWPTDETWVYSYDVSDNLTDVTSRNHPTNPTITYGKLVFRYDGNSNLQIVGDQTFDDTDPQNPTGRYVTYTYVPNKVDQGGGSIGNGSEWLLSEVEDLRGETWEYNYNDTDVEQLNWMIARLSPTINGSQITLEELTYQNNVQLDLAVNGGMELDDTSWRVLPGVAAETTVNEQSDVDKDSGTYSRYVEAVENQGVEGQPWNLMEGKTYTITARVKVVSGGVKMQVTDTTDFDDSSTSSSWATLTAANITPGSGGTLYNRRLQFVGTDNTVTNKFYVDNVTIIETNPDYSAVQQKRGIVGTDPALMDTTLKVAPHQNFSEETMVNRTTTHQFDRALYAGTIDPNGNTSRKNPNSSFRPADQVDANGNMTRLKWNGNGRNLEQVTDANSNVTAFSYQSNGVLHTSDGADGNRTIYAYENKDVPRKPTLIVATNGSNLAVNGDMENDSDWGIAAGSPVNQQVPGAPQGQFVHLVETDAANEGIEQTNTITLEANKNYLISAEVFVISGGPATLQLDSQNGSVDSVATGVWETLSFEYAPTVQETPKLQLLAATNTKFCVDAVSVHNLDDDKVVPIANGDFETDNDWQAVGTPPTDQRVGASTGQFARRVDAAVSEGIEGTAFTVEQNRSYLVLARVFPISGTVKMKVHNISGFDDVTDGTTDNWQTLKAVYTHSSSPVSANLQFLAENAAAHFLVDSVYILDNTQIQRWQEFEYTAGQVSKESQIDPTNPNGDAIQLIKREYYGSGDGAGLLKTVKTYETDEQSDHQEVQYTYDAYGRVIQTKRLSSMAGDCCGSTTQYDAAGNITETKNIPDWSNQNDPDTNPTTQHVYDELGRRVQTTTNVGTSFDQSSYTVYDALDRVVLSVTNYEPQATTPDQWEWAWNATANRWQWEDGQGVAIDFGADNTQNIISQTVYNERGEVRLQRDVLGNVTLFGYDDAGRLVKTIRNAATADHNNTYLEAISGNDPDPDLSNYPYTNPGVLSTAADADLVTKQVYDPAGNVVKSIDPLGKVTFTVYDALNRPIQTVQSASDPNYPILTDLSLGGYSFSSEADEDIVTTTQYDALGRVDRSIDVSGNINLTVYDTLGRVVRTVNNYVDQNGTLASDWEWKWNAAASQWQWEDGQGVAIDFGNNNDQNVITDTIYDTEGRVQSTRDVSGRLTYSVYDDFGRQVLSVNNYVAQATTPDQWEWANGQWEDGDTTPTAISFGTDNDQNVITETVYDANGRVQYTRDVLGRVNYNVYDSQGRQYRTVSNYVAQTPTPANWEWANNRWEDGQGVAISFGTDNDQNVISDTTYDDQGRVQSTRDVSGQQTYNVYDELGRQRLTVRNYVAQTTTPENWVWANSQWEDGQGTAIEQRSDLINQPDNYDQNAISTTEYDIAGRVTLTRDTLGRLSTTVYDDSGRRIRSVSNFVAQATDPDQWVWNINRWEDGQGGAIEHRSNTEVENDDQNLISETTYNKGGQTVATRDARGTQTTFVYDLAGRQQMVTSAAGTRKASSSYTVYDKSGRVLRRIAGYVPQFDNSGQLIPAASWDLTTLNHGSQHDTNLVTVYAYDALGRQIQVTNPEGDVSQTQYDVSGQVLTSIQQDIVVKDEIDPINIKTQYRYDGLRRRKRVVQAFADSPNTEDPSEWVWNSGWKESDGTTAINHGTNNDRNIIAEASYDISGRMTSLREPRGNLTTLTYDQLGRRKTRTNALNKTWTTAFDAPAIQGSTSTLTDPNAVDTERSFDQLGRLAAITYNNPANTPDVDFAYDLVGNRERMSEYDDSSHVAGNRIRETIFDYDAARRMIAADFDTDGDGTIDETVSYEYDVSGRRTQMTLPGSLAMTYSYNQRGQLSSMSDWDGNTTNFYHDQVGRHVGTRRSNNLISTYLHDGAGRLRRIRHLAGQSLRSEFEYEVDGRGNRTRAYETLAQPTSSVTYDKDATQVTYPTGTWSDNGSYKQTTDFGADLEVTWSGDEAILIVGTGTDHGIFDLYLDGVFWRSIDGYSAQSGEKAIRIPDGGTLRIKNRSEHHKDSTGYKLQFKQLDVLTVTYDQQTIDYEYDAVSRLLSAEHVGTSKRFDYTFDLSGNRTSEAIDSGTPTTYTYNAINQITNSGFTYDNNGNLINEGVNVYTWDRANRMVNHSWGISHLWRTFTYDGAGNRVQQAQVYSPPPPGSQQITATDYILDLQPGLAQVIAATTSGNTERYVHGLRGIHAMEDSAGVWSHPAQDGLGSVRMEMEDLLEVVASGDYEPFGEKEDVQGTFGLPFGFTGEQTDGNGQVYLRARYYTPSIGVFPSLDPFEGVMNRPMSLNGYSWVEGNPIMNVDPSGLQAVPPSSPCAYLLAADRQIPESYEQYVHCLIGIGQRDQVCPPGYELLSAQEEAIYMGSYMKPMCRYLVNNEVVPARVAVRDVYGIKTRGISPYSFENLIPLLNIPIPANPCGKPYKGGSYVEGGVHFSGAILGVNYGRETTYDFANMQKAQFSYYGGSGSWNIGYSLSIYAGTGEGFHRDSRYGDIEQQYAGPFMIASISTGLQSAKVLNNLLGVDLGLNVGFSTYSSLPGSYPFIRGGVFSVSSGFSFENIAPIGLDATIVNYVMSGTVKEFAIDSISSRDRKYVDPDEIATEIRNGDVASLLPGPVLDYVYTQTQGTLVRLMREAVIPIARQWAEVYNKRTDCEKGVASYPNDKLNQITGGIC